MRSSATLNWVLLVGCKLVLISNKAMLLRCILIIAVCASCAYSRQHGDIHMRVSQVWNKFVKSYIVFIHNVRVDELTAHTSAQGSQHTLPTVGICVIHKDQNEDVKEWVDYHLALGITKIYFFDNNSTVPIRETLAQYHGAVHYEDVATQEAAPLNPQLFVYRKCLARKDVQWIAFIDLDEFIVLKATPYSSLPAFLNDYADEGALAVNWVNANQSGDSC